MDGRPAYNWSDKGSFAAAYTGICFLLVLKVLRGFAVKSPVGDFAGTKTQ